MNTQVGLQSRSVKLQDLPKHYQLLLPPPARFQDEARLPTEKVSYNSIATGMDEEIPDGYFLHPSSGTTDNVGTETSEESTEFPGFSDFDTGRPASELVGQDGHYHRSLGEVMLQHQNLQASLSMTTVCSNDSSTSDVDVTESIPTLPKYFFPGLQFTSNSEESKALQITELLNSCRTYSDYNLRIQEDSEEDAEEEEEFDCLMPPQDMQIQNSQNFYFPPTFSGALFTEKPLEYFAGRKSSTSQMSKEIDAEKEDVEVHSIRDVEVDSIREVEVDLIRDVEVEETETNESNWEDQSQSSRTYSISRSTPQESDTEDSVQEGHSSSENGHGYKADSSEDEGTRHMELSNTENEESNVEESAHSHDPAPRNFFNQRNVVTVATTLSESFFPRLEVKIPGKETSTQTDVFGNNQISVQTLSPENREIGVQTRIEAITLERIISPPLSMTTYTQTLVPDSAVQDDLYPISGQNKEEKEKECSLPLGELSQAFGHSILESFGRKCMSMHNISDWNSSKFYFLANFDGNSYRRKFTHAEAMLYTVMCQDSFQPQLNNGIQGTNSSIYYAESHTSITSSMLDDLEERGHFPNLAQAQIRETAPRFSTELIPIIPPSSTQGTTNLQDPDSINQVSPTENLQNPAGHLSNTNSTESVNSNQSDGSNDSDTSIPYGYIADDEFSVGDEDDNPSPPRPENIQDYIPRSSAALVVPLTRHAPHNRRHHIRSTSGRQTLATVAQVLPLVSGAVIKRIIKRGELKPTMSDFC